MDIRRLDLNLLVVLEAIHAEGSLTRAARRLNLSQPAISHALGRLREALDDPLFLRQGNRMVPTPRTLRLMAPLHEALGLIAEGIQEGARFDATRSQQEFRLGMRDIFESTALPGLLARLRRRGDERRRAVRRRQHRGRRWLLACAVIVVAALAVATLAQAPASGAGAAPRRFEPQVGPWRTFELTTTVNVADVQGVTRLWLPVPDVDTTDGVTVTHRVWDGCAAATELYRQDGAGHTWPGGWPYFGEDRIGRVGRDIGNDQLLDFFASHVAP